MAVGLLLLPVLLVTIDNTVLNFALPAIAADLQPTATQQLWLIDVYPLVLCSLLVAGGNLGDRLGRRRTLMVGVSGFALASIGAAFTPTAELLLAARIATGVFGAVILPATHSLVRSMFHDRSQRRIAIAVLTTGFASGAALGPIIGGWLVGGFGWPAIFLLAVPLSIPLLLGAPKLIDEYRDPDPGPVDFGSIVLSATTLAPMVYAIKHVAGHGVDVIAIAGLLIGVGSGALLAYRLLHRENPMLDIRLFRNPGFTGSILANLVNLMGITGFLFFAAQHLQLIAGLTPFQAAWALVPGAIANVIVGFAVVRIVRYVRPGIALVSGLLLAATAYALTAATSGSATIATIAVAYLLIGIGSGATGTTSNDIMLANVPPTKAGAAAAVSETAYELGTVLGVTVLGGVLTGIYRGTLQPPAGIDAEQAAAARETLAGAVEVARTVPEPASSDLITAAATAFDAGAATASMIATGLLVVASAVIFTLVRKQTA